MTPLWTPSPARALSTNLAAFSASVGLDPLDYAGIHAWSIDEPDAFWRAVWDFCEDTVARVFTETPSDHVVGRLLVALQAAGSVGLDGSAQRDLFSRHLAGTRLAAARWELERRGLTR